MSSVKAMKIQGIRSFGPEDRDEATIRFSSPLTLILGENGCGKTTIIEALKFASCGELPSGVDSGSGFVHDPKLCSLIEIRGKVALQCVNTKGKDVTVFRAVQVTQKTRKLEFKRLDSTLSVPDKDDPSKKNQVSGRCVDIDTAMCDALGVSKAILSYVIFCHQEDSNWPLEKGKKMKERFDAIFGITDYNKCLDNIKGLIKKKKNENSQLELRVGFADTTANEARTKRENLEKEQTKLLANRDNIAQYDEDIKPLQRQLKEVMEREANIAKYTADIRMAKKELEMLKQTQRELKREIKNEYEGTTEHLEEEIANFETVLREKESGVRNFELEKEKAIRGDTSVQQKISVEQMRLGQLQTNHEQNSKRINQCNDDIVTLSEDLLVPLTSTSRLNERDFSFEAIMRLDKKLKEKREDTERMRATHEHTEQAYQQRINECRDKKASYENEVKNKRQQKASNRQQLKKIETEIAQVDRSTSMLAELDGKLRKAEADLERQKSLVNADQLKDAIDVEMIRRDKLEEKLSILDTELKSLQVVALEQAELKRCNDQIQSKRGKLQALQNTHNDTLRRLLGGEIPTSGLKREFTDRISELNDQIVNIQRDISDRKQRLATLKANKHHVSKKISELERKISRNEEKMFDTCGSEDYDSLVNSVSAKINEVQEKKGLKTSSSFLFQRYIAKMSETDDPQCPLCHRGFANLDETRDIVDDLSKRMRDFPTQVTELANELSRLQKQYSELLQLKPLKEENNKLKADIAASKSKLEKVNAEINALDGEMIELNERLTRPQEDESKCKSMQSDVDLMDQYGADLKQLEQDAIRMRKKLDDMHFTRNLEEAQNEQETIKNEWNALRRKLESDQAELTSHNDKMNKLTECKNKIIAEQLKVQGGAAQRSSLVERLEELRLEENRLEVEVDEANKQLNIAADDMRQITNEMNATKNAQKASLASEMKTLSNYERRYEEIRKLHEEITEYERKGGAEELERKRQNVIDLQKERNSYVEKRTLLDEKISEAKQAIANQERNKFDLENNLKLRRKQAEERSTVEKISQLEGSIGPIDLGGILDKKNELNRKLNDLIQQKARVQGRIVELQDKILQMETELNKDLYKNAETEFRKLTISSKVRTLAVKDLQKYYAAMDWAMIHFHKERMKMINTIVRTLWREIYRGNDIDTIEIKTDEATAGGDRRRTYNYRVVQIKNGIELDMPGRCSAGQKVLACLIIRMALAETFSKNCGILALDEPTTNLDRQNIDSLAIALAEIVERRSRQHNFQLLVITHDEEFLLRLSRVEKVEHYLKVLRNERGKSEVQKIRLM